ncbi:hypothetical protein CR513_46956, partial [Mucuna pruriens]
MSGGRGAWLVLRLAKIIDKHELYAHILRRSPLYSHFTPLCSTFAWAQEEMPGIDLDFLCHRFSIITGTHLIAKKRKMGDEKRMVAKEEIRKLLAANFIKEVRYPT